MRYHITYYSEAIQQQFLDLPDGIQANMIRITERMAEHGPNLGMPYTRAMGDGLFEIRAHGREGAGRAFFCNQAGQHIVILHIFVKKTQETPQREIDIARKHMKRFQHGKK